MATKKTAAKKNGAKKGMSTSTKVEIGAGILAAAAAAGAGYYFYGDKNAKKHRQAASKWAKGMKQEVVREAKSLKKIDQKAVAGLVDRAAAAYQGVRSVDPKDLRQAATELKKHWRDVQQEIVKVRGSVRSVRKSAGAAKKTVKKSAPKKAAKNRPAGGKKKSAK